MPVQLKQASFDKTSSYIKEAMDSMIFDKKMLQLYAVTDRGFGNEDRLYAQVETALRGGVTMVQLREKHMDDKDFIEEARKIKMLTKAYHVPLIINDNIHVCVESEADGVHVGQSDMEAGHVREILGPDKIIGVTAKTPEQALAAQCAGADYIGCGAVFGSSTKLDTNKISMEQLDAVCAAVNIPVVAIGGINRDNILQLKGHKMCGAAVVSALFAKENVEEAAKELLAKVREILE